MRGHNSQGSVEIKPTDQMQNSTDLLISFFWLFCCLLSVMRIMLGVRTEVRHFHIILKGLINTTAVPSASAALVLGLFLHRCRRGISEISGASSHAAFTCFTKVYSSTCLCCFILLRFHVEYRFSWFKYWCFVNCKWIYIVSGNGSMAMQWLALLPHVVT